MLVATVIIASMLVFPDAPVAAGRPSALPGGTAWLAGVVIAEQLFADASLTSGGMAANYPPFDLTIFGKATTWTVSTTPA